jgi:hypothetical protein
MLAVAVGHWLVAEPINTLDGLMIRDVLADLPAAGHLTWLFQVIPLFMVAGIAAGIRSWRRHRERGGAAGATRWSATESHRSLGDEATVVRW